MSWSVKEIPLEKPGPCGWCKATIDHLEVIIEVDNKGNEVKEIDWPRCPVCQGC